MLVFFVFHVFSLRCDVTRLNLQYDKFVIRYDLASSICTNAWA